MTFHWFDPTTGKGGSTTEGWSRVPDSAKPYTYLDKGEADEAKENFMTYEDRGNVDTTPRRTPITTPAPVATVGAGFDPTQGGTITPPAEQLAPSMDERIYLDYEGTDEGGDYRQSGGKKTYLPKDSFALKQPSPMPAPPVPMKPITLPSGQTVEIPDIDMEAVNASLAAAGIIPQIPQAPAPVVPQPMAPQAMPSMPSLPSVTLPKLPTLGSRPSLTRSPMRGNPRER